MHLPSCALSHISSPPGLNLWVGAGSMVCVILQPCRCLLQLLYICTSLYVCPALWPIATRATPNLMVNPGSSYINSWLQLHQLLAPAASTPGSSCIKEEQHRHYQHHLVDFSSKKRSSAPLCNEATGPSY